MAAGQPQWLLYGPSGSGKSALGNRLAAALGLPWVDLDAEIASAAGMTIAEIFAASGETGFREGENRALQEACAAGKEQVISLGGGALLDPRNRKMAEEHGTVLVLRASPDTLLTRLQRDEVERPLLEGSPAENLASYLARRREHYDSFAFQVDTTALKIHEALREVQIRLGAFRVSGMGRPYDVRVGPGLLESVGDHARGRQLKGPWLVASDTEVGPHFSDSACQSLSGAGYQVRQAAVPAGEVFKTIETAGFLWGRFLEAGLERRSTVAALGGGVVGDLVGFAAATYLRGISWVNLPTSLLAMVDACLGGKTGADLPQGKNLVGAFHAPALVLADTEALKTLPGAEYRAGLAEVIKHGVIADPLLVHPASFEGDPAGLVSRAMAVKVDVITQDPFEGGRREVLNYGHTIGHAVERVSDYRVRHGEAVAIGMVAEARLAERIGLAAAGVAREISHSLEAVGLPVDIPAGLDPEELRSVLNTDKKKSGGRVLFALPVRIGQVQRGIPIEEKTLMAILQGGR